MNIYYLHSLISLELSLAKLNIFDTSLSRYLKFFFVRFSSTVLSTPQASDDLLSEVQRITGEKSRTKAITIAMKEYVRQQKIKELLALRGKIKIDYNREKEEELEMKHQEEGLRIFWKCFRPLFSFRPSVFRIKGEKTRIIKY